jgi:hypothetical protein
MGRYPMLGYRRKSIWLVLACTAFAVQAVPQACSEDCERGCCVAPATCCQATTDASPCRCQLEAKQDQTPAVHEVRSSQRDDLPVWGEVADATALNISRGLAASRSYAVAAQSIPIRPVRILYGVWLN